MWTPGPSKVSIKSQPFHQKSSIIAHTGLAFIARFDIPVALSIPGINDSFVPMLSVSEDSAYIYDLWVSARVALYCSELHGLRTRTNRKVYALSICVLRPRVLQVLQGLCIFSVK